MSPCIRLFKNCFNSALDSLLRDLLIKSSTWRTKTALFFLDAEAFRSRVREQLFVLETHNRYPSARMVQIDVDDWPSGSHMSFLFICCSLSEIACRDGHRRLLLLSKGLIIDMGISLARNQTVTRALRKSFHRNRRITAKRRASVGRNASLL